MIHVDQENGKDNRQGGHSHDCCQVHAWKEESHCHESCQVHAFEKKIEEITQQTRRSLPFLFKCQCINQQNSKTYIDKLSIRVANNSNIIVHE